jgi:hypothetical protein
MRGGSVRFQAQTLRRVRIPQFERLSKEIVTALAEVSDESSQQLIDEAACLAFDV